jgi:hypothetical protein
LRAPAIGRRLPLAAPRLITRTPS